MKKIGIDARLFSKTGVGVYIRNLLYYLQKHSPSGIQYYIYVLDSDADSIHFSSSNFVKRPVPYLWHSLSEQTGFLKTLNADNLDLMHFTYFSYPVFYRRKFIATLHDTILLEHKTGKASTKNSLIYELKHLVFRYVVQSQIQNAVSIITPTKTVRQNIIKLFGDQYEKKIVPVYEGLNYEFLNAVENSELKNQFQEPFFIYVGNFYPHKNIEKLVQAFSKVKTESSLILIGPDDFFSQRISQLITSLNQVKRIILCHDAGIENLVFFYKHARALIHPSLSEGFGLPLIEAAHYNLPVIASDIDVFKELLGSHYISFNPYDEADIRQKIESFEQEKRSDYSKDLLNSFSFEQMSLKTLELYNQNV